MELENIERSASLSSLTRDLRKRAESVLETYTTINHQAALLSQRFDRRLQESHETNSVAELFSDLRRRDANFVVTLTDCLYYFGRCISEKCLRDQACPLEHYLESLVREGGTLDGRSLLGFDLTTADAGLLLNLGRFCGWFWRKTPVASGKGISDLACKQLMFALEDVVEDRQLFVILMKVIRFTARHILPFCALQNALGDH